MRHEVMEIAGGIGLRIEIDNAHGLGEVTESLTRLCDQAECGRAPSFVVASLGSTSSIQRPLPGMVGAQDLIRWGQAVRRFEQLTTVTIAVAGDSCVGPELDLLLTTSYRITTNDFRMIIPVSESYFWLDRAVDRLVSQLGVNRARQVVLPGGEISAQEAVEWGIIDEVTADTKGAVQAAVQRFLL